MPTNISEEPLPTNRRRGLLKYTEQLRESDTKDWNILVAKITSSGAQTKALERSDVITWVSKESDSTEQPTPGTTRIIFTHSLELVNGDLRADYAPLPKSHMRELIEKWDLPPLFSFLRLRGNGSGALYRRCTRDPTTNTITSIGVMLQTPYKIRIGAEAVWSAAYNWNVSTQSANVLIDAMSPDLRPVLIEFLQEVPERRQHPLWISQLILEALIGQFAIRQQGLENAIYTLEENLGFTVGISNESVWTQDHLFFRNVTADCNLYNTWLTIMERLLDFGLSLADFLLETQLFLEEEGILQKESRESKEFTEEIWNYKNHLRAQIKLSQALSRRTTALLSIVNIIVAQLDSKVTTTIATATKRDSSSMITVAFLTTLFLPGTFVSSLFGTNFFNFLAPLPTGTTVAGNFWIYWAITIPLTMFVMASWQLWMRYFAKSTNGNFGESKLERKKTEGKGDGTDGEKVDVDGKKVNGEGKEEKMNGNRTWIASKYRMWERWNKTLPRRVRNRGGDIQRNVV